MASRNSSRDIASGWIWLSAIAGLPFPGSVKFSELGLEHVQQLQDIVHANGVKPGIARRKARVRPLVAQAETGDRLQFDVEAAAAQRRLQPAEDLERAAA